MIKKLELIYEWLEAYVDYFIDDEPADGEETDAQRLKPCLPALRQAINQLKNPPKVQKERKSKEKLYTQEEVDSLLFSTKKIARESINPNYRYCIVGERLEECYLTDDIGAAMEKAATLSKLGTQFWNICRIYKANDGSYRTRIEGFCANGKYCESSMASDYLHWDYIASAVRKVLKV